MAYQSFTNASLFDVKGKVAIVTGGATGVGKAIATALAINGAKVVICGRRADVTEAAAVELSKAADEAQQGGKVIGIQADVATKQGVVDFFDKAVQHIDKLDFLVNNAGFSSNWRDSSSLATAETLEKKLWSIEDSDWANMTAVHVAGPYYLAVKFISLFAKSDDPSILNITSLASIFLNRKAAEAHMTKLMAAGLGPLKIRVNSIAPGLFPSQLTTDADGKLYGPMQSQLANIPKGRAGTLEEIAGPVLMLASPAGAYFNGAELLIDAGWAMNSSARDV